MATTYQDQIDELRTHTSDWLRAERSAVVVERRHLEVRELAITRVLDERASRDREAEDGLIAWSRDSARTARQKVDVARALESLPEIAAKAEAGERSWDQLEPLSRLATPETDSEWAQRGPNYAPTDLTRMARLATPVTSEDQAKRRDARELRWWDDHARGGLALRGFLPDVDGVLAKNVLERMIGRMKPPKGERWDTIAHRGADAFIDLCTKFADAEATGKHKPLVVLHRNGDGTAEVDGIPIAPETLDELRADARVVEQVDDAPPVDFGAGRFALPASLQRIVDHRDRHCRWPGCESTWRLDNHHLIPVAWGGTTSRKTVVKACHDHHPRLEPHGSYRLVGDPDLPDGLRVIDTRITTTSDARAGPGP